MTKGTTLNDFLDTLEKDSIIAIGAKNGSNFVYIGEAGNKELIDECFKNCLTKVKSIYRADKAELELNCHRSPKMYDHMETEYEAAYAYAKMIQKLVQKIDSESKYIAEYKPVMEREIVVKPYRKEVDDCLAIIVSGRELGDCWFKSEFDKKHKK